MEAPLKKKIQFFFYMEGVPVQVCYMGMLQDAKVWGTNPVTQLVSIVSDW